MLHEFDNSSLESINGIKLGGELHCLLVNSLLIGDFVSSNGNLAILRTVLLEDLNMNEIVLRSYVPLGHSSRSESSQSRRQAVGQVESMRL